MTYIIALMTAILLFLIVLLWSCCECYLDQRKAHRLDSEF